MRIETYPAEEFLERRKKGIGGSDIGAIMNVSAFKTPLDVYCDKLGLVDPIEPSFAMRMGNSMEAIIEKEYLLATGNYLTHTGRETTKDIIYKDEFYYYHPDGIVSDVLPDKYLGIWEAKYSNRYDAWGVTPDEIPLEYLYQVQWGMFCSGLPFAELSLIIGREYRQFRIERDDALIATLKTAVDSFWNDYVLKETPPPLSEKKSDEELLTALYADDASQFTADVEVVELADEFLALKDEIDRLGTAQQGVRNKIQAKMQNSNLCTSDYFKISWKQSKDRVTIDYKKAYSSFIEAMAEVMPSLKKEIYSFEATSLDSNTTTKAGSRPFSVKRVK